MPILSQNATCKEELVLNWKIKYFKQNKKQKKAATTTKKKKKKKNRPGSILNIESECSKKEVKPAKTRYQAAEEFYFLTGRGEKCN